MADTWQAISGYASNNYSDTMVFEVDGATKKLQKISGQTLIAGEKNSQYIRFMMPRYWDGIDVSEKTISIIYGLAGQYYGETAAISAERTDDSLRFGWVVPEEACCIAGTLLFVLVIKDSTYVLKSQITEVPVLKSINLDDVIPEPTKEAWYADFQVRVGRTLSAAENAVEEAQSTLAQARSLIGSPLVANTAADMTETSRIYVYTGSETGYTNGHWYYHNGSAWTDGGVYNAVAVDTDTTLTIAGKPADSKKTGDEISQIKEDLNEITEKMKKVVSENKWDTENETVGAITANGTVYPNYTSYVYPNTPIEVNEGDVVRSYGINAGGGFATAGMRWLCAYDTEMNPVTASGSNASITSYTVPAGIKYIRPSFNSGGQKRMLTINYEASSWINYEVHYEAGDEFHTDIKMAQTNFGELYLDYSMLNRLDPTDCQTGKFINGTTGAISDNASYYVTNYMEIRSGETLYFMQRDTKVAVNARTVAVYDANKTLLDTLGTNTSTDHFTQTGKAAFIRCSFAYSASDIIRTPYGIGVMTSATPRYVTGYGDAPTISKDSIRPVINVYATDSEQSIIGKFVQAFNHGDCDVAFERASYSFGTQLATVKDDYHLFENEIPIGNGCRYFFNGATLTALISPSSTPSCNFLGCQKRPSSYELHDGVLIAHGTVYVVHDESSAYGGAYKHLYQNMEMHYYSNSRTDEIRKCIGGGTGASGVIEIVGCKFTTDAVDACVSYHGNGTDVTGAEFDLAVRDSYFSNGIRAGELSAHQTARLFYTGNSSASAPLSYARWTVTSFLNEIRG